MRIDATALSSLLQSAQSLSTKQVTIVQQLSSGVRISALSDDPSAVGRSAELTASLAQSDAFLQSAATSTSRLQAADAALGSVVTQLTSAISLAVKGANDTNNTVDRQTLATQLSSIQESIRSFANSSYSGTYLFAGSASTAEPFTAAADGSISYVGDAETNSLSLSNGDSVPVSVSGADIFANSSAPVFGALQAVIKTLLGGQAPSTDQVAALRNSLTAVTTQRAVLGADAARVQTESTYAGSQQATTKAEQSTLIQADPVALATELSSVETQRSALLSTLAVVQKGSLFDYL